MAPKDEKSEADDKAREEAIRQLLVLCAERQVDIPDDLRATVLGEEYVREEKEAEKKEPLLSSLLSERAESFIEEEHKLADEVRKKWDELKAQRENLELRVVDGSYEVTNYINLPDTDVGGDDEEQRRKQTKPKYDTVLSLSLIGRIFEATKRLVKTGKCTRNRKAETKKLLDGVNLRFEPGKMYLVLGAPGAGKSTLLKLIADTLRKDRNHVVGGTVAINDVSPTDEGVFWSNLVSYTDQIDRLHAYLTVFETLKFAYDCRRGGTHALSRFALDDPEVSKIIQSMDEELFAVNKVLEGLGILRVKDTFVGNNTSVRGVSGGEKKRVTVAEMTITGAPISCLDEISTGLDSATTYDITDLIGRISRMSGSIKIVSLLAPPPETVALFDEIILIDSGHVIYSGPTQDVIGHFESLGYQIPERMDMADWLVALPTPDGKNFLIDEKSSHLSAEEFREKFESTGSAKQIQEALSAPLSAELTKVDDDVKKRYKNSTYRSLRLVVNREMLLWWRDKYQIKARLAQDIIMGVVAGTLFWQQWDNPQSVMGILFQAMFFVSVGAMLKVPDQFEPRGIFYKHQDANFFPTWTYVAGRSVAGVPTSLTDGVVFGTIIYWFVGLAYNDGASIANYFIFMLLILAGSLTAGLMFSIFSATVKDKPTAQACMSVSIAILVLFSGFTVQPDVIPDYYIWIYWLNMFAWILRGLVVNEYQSGKYDEPAGNGLTYGENVLVTFGFTLNGEPFGFEWVWYALAFACGIAIVSVLASVLFLSILRFETGMSLDTGDHDNEDAVDISTTAVAIPFQKVNLTFQGIHYTVKSSITDEDIELLKGIDGYVEAGKMTALMGSSGAGKTTLMDVLALRKSSGEILGEVCLNGHLQEPKSFRRCTGYVEQFDEQSPSLTIRETVDFSARLRLEETDPTVTQESTEQLVTQTLEMLELLPIQDLQVGTDLTGGLSFEQKKRLSIAVELVANPSILFLDEPTSGLDARAAGIVMRGLKRIALTGRAVCATIHQPSIAVFSSFDSLLLLKRGGETVFFGELGNESSKLIEYLERYDATDKIRPGENPATWMLTCIGAGGSPGTKQFDYAASYAGSKLRDENIARIENFCSEASDENLVSFPSKYATSKGTQRKAVLARIMKIYWRSPSYNLVRLIVSLAVALLYGSVYASQRTPENEADMNSRVTSIFITAIFLAVNAYNTVLSVFEIERNMFYRHKASLMYNARAIAGAFTIAEIPFILLASMVFCVGFYFLVGFATDPAYKFFLYYLFFTLNLGVWTFSGQMVMSLVRDSVTAQGFGGLLIGLTSLFSGLLIRPQDITGFWIFAYWLLPGHYVLEGLITSQFNDDDTPIEASFGSPFYEDIPTCTGDPDVPCYGTAEQWVEVSFGGKFQFDHIPWNILYLVGVLLITRLLTLFGLAKFNYLAK